jgi:protein-disulfide isomerase
MDKRFLAIVAAVVIALGGVFFFTRSKNDTAGPDAGAQRTNHVKGAGTSGVEIVEFGDFQCPACEFFYPMLLQARTKYGDQIKFTFKHFPIAQIHDKAIAAHKAAEAAAAQGKFWEMHDLLYERQNEWGANGLSIEGTERYFESYAAQLGLDIEKFKTDVRSSVINDLIKADIEEGQSKDVASTPTFFINGERLDAEVQRNIRTAENLFTLIDQAIAEKQANP